MNTTIGWPNALPPQLFSSVSAVRSSWGTSSQLSQSESEPRTSPPPTLPVSQVTGDSWIFILNVCTTMRENKRVLNDDQPRNTVFKLSHTPTEWPCPKRRGCSLHRIGCLCGQNIRPSVFGCERESKSGLAPPCLSPTGIPHRSLFPPPFLSPLFSLLTVVLLAFFFA